MRLWIGLDDTDSNKGMCTTYLAVLIIEELERRLGRLIGFPRIVRLNPTIPYKTRGNGAVSFLVEIEDVNEAMEIVNEVILENAMLDDDNTNPGAVFVEDSDLVERLKMFALKAIRGVVSLNEALLIIEKHFIPYLKIAIIFLGGSLFNFILWSILKVVG